MASKVSKAVVVDFARIQATYGLGRETLAALSAFRKRATDASVQNSLLNEAKNAGKIDFAHYRSILKNTAVIDEIENALKTFKPVTQDASANIKAIEAFEAKAVSLATATTSKIEEAVVDLKQDLINVETARPVDELTVDELVAAVPELRDVADIHASNGSQDVEGYYAKFGGTSVL